MEIAIAGAGIAGLAAASFLRRLGHRVVLFDQFETPAPVGSGLIIQPTGQAVFAQLDLGAALRQRSARIDRLYGRVSDTGHDALNVRYSALGDDVHGIGVHRAALFAILFDAAASSGAALEQASEVRTIERCADGRARLNFSDGRRSASFDLVVDALGLHSPLNAHELRYLDYGALWVNLPAAAAISLTEHMLEQRYFRASVTAGIMPIGRPGADAKPMSAFFWSLRRDQLSTWRAAGLDRWKDDVAQLWPEIAPLLVEIRDAEQLVFARYAHHMIRQPVKGCIVHIGDSWHAASPQLGQGANMALLDAYALAKALEVEPDIDAALRAFAKIRQTHIRLYQAISGMFTPFYQSDSAVLPWLRDRIATPLSQFAPIQTLLAAMVAGTLGNPYRALGLSA